MSLRALGVIGLIAAPLLLAAGAGAAPRDASMAQQRSHRVVQTYQGGLNFPVDMAWVHGTKKIFFTQKNGKIRVMVGRKLKKRPCTSLNVNEVNERGLLGIALGPHFKRSHHLFVYYTHASPLENRVTRFTVHHNRCRNKTDILTGISASSSGYHNGGQIDFVRGKMYVSVGEAHNAGNAQIKTMRYRPDGSIPRGTRSARTGTAIRCGLTGIATHLGLPTSREPEGSSKPRTGPSATTR